MLRMTQRRIQQALLVVGKGLALIARVSPESEAEYVISTVHRAKGLEWSRVKIMGDFRFKTDEDGRKTLPDDEKRLLYAALSHAKHLMDLSDLKGDLLQVFNDAKAVR